MQFFTCSKISHQMAHLMQVWVLVMFLVGTLLVGTYAQEGEARLRLLSAMEPPRRPHEFSNVGELNQYLEELRSYYTILGRPRFGRSTEHVSNIRKIQKMFSEARNKNPSQ